MFKKLIRRIKLLYWYGDTLDEVINEKIQERSDKVRKAQHYHLNLCKGHMQEHNHSHYSSKNCDYCKLLKAYKRVTTYRNVKPKPGLVAKDLEDF